jgi:hypothetical protein
MLHLFTQNFWVKDFDPEDRSGVADVSRILGPSQMGALKKLFWVS